VAAQYYNFRRLGRDGYARVHQACRDTAMGLAADIAAIGPFELVSDGSALPVLAVSLTDGTGYSVYDVSDGMRARGRCRRTPSRRTSRTCTCCVSWCETASARTWPGCFWPICGASSPSWSPPARAGFPERRAGFRH